MERPDLLGREWCRAYSDACDRWLAELVNQASSGDTSDLALVAVGGYAKRRLCPGSDLDLLLVHSDRSDIAQVAEALWYPIWDDGVRLDHSVRTPREALSVAADDLPAALGMLDLRLIAGSQDVGAELVAGITHLWRSNPKRWVQALEKAASERSERYGELAFLLEPDLKEARGGLRDLDIILALDRLVTLGVDRATSAMLQASEAVLLAARVELHRPSGRSVDRLLLQEQDRVAGATGYRDADALMAAVAEAGRNIAWVADDALQRAIIRSTTRSRKKARYLSAAIALDHGEVCLSDTAQPESDPALALRVAETAAQLGVPIARSTLARLGEEIVDPPQVWPAELRDALVSLLGMGRSAIAPLEALDQVGVSARLMPEWQVVRNKPQRNAYHRYTVDRHLLETAAAAARSVRKVGRPDLLLIAALLHDIGKGRPGDHTEVGTRLVSDMAPRMGFSPQDTARLVALVQHHLLLADVATRRDLEDPATIEVVASAVGDRETLGLLAALTEADGLATGPSAWSPWKAALVTDLVARVESRLSGVVELPRKGLSTNQLALVADGEVALSVDGGTLSVVAPDRPGLLASVAGVLALNGLAVRSATAISGTEETRAADGSPMAVEELEIHAAFDQSVSWQRIERDLRSALDGRLELHSRLRERARVYEGTNRTKAARLAEPLVLVHNDASEAATVIEVRAPDGVGVLYRIATALAACGLDVISARVATLGHEVVDSFYLTDSEGQKVQDDVVLTQAKTMILEALST